MKVSQPYTRWSRPRCPELVAGSRKQVEVVISFADLVVL